MKVSRIRQRALVFAIAGLTVGVTACSSASSAGGSASSGASGAPELSTITIGAVLSADTVTLQIAEDKGFFKQQGLNVKIIPEATTNATATGLLSHTMDFGDQNYIGMLEQEKTVPGLNQRVVADDTQASMDNDVLIVGKNSKLTSIAQLKGKKVSVPALGTNFAAVALDVLMKPYAMTSTDYTTVVVPFANAAQALARNEVDAAFVIEPFITTAEAAAGDRVLVDMTTGAMSAFPVTCWVTSASFAQQNPKTVAAFQRAMASALQVAATNPSYVRSELPKLIPTMKPTIANVINLPTYNTTLSLTRLERVADVMKQVGALPQNFDVKPMYDPLAGSAS
ncbi:MAG: NitT/TauT family transport system substrate-binding protein [Trebonia sp.]|nr:NitT/TauT family transport system substrate-binding protein [Trebonia sp.]